MFAQTKGRSFEAFSGGVNPRGLRWSEVVTRLRQAGCKIAFVLIADSLFYDPWHDPNFARAAEIGTPLDIPIFDLRKATGIETLSWTDAIHLTAPAARTMAEFIEKEIIPLAK